MMVHEVTAIEGASLVESGSFLLDVRNADEWTAGRSLAATWIPLAELENRFAEVPSDRQVICICKVGGRSLKATEFLVGKGIDAANLAGGMRAWAEAGLAVIAADGNPGQVI